MEGNQTVAVWIAMTPLLSICSSPAVWAAASPEQIGACTNAVVLELDGVPRSEVTITPDVTNGSEFLHWQTQDGRAGFCRVGSDGSVDRFGIDQAEMIDPGPVVTYGIPDRAGAVVIVATAGGDLNVRQNPGGEIVRSVSNGDSLTLTGQTSGEWIELEGGGWVSRFLVMPVDQGNSLTSNPAASQGAALSSSRSPNQAIVVTEGSGLYVRQEANGKIIGSIADGSLVTLTGQRRGDWVEIEEGGWVSEVYLQY